MIKLKDPFYTLYEMPTPIYYFDKEMNECLLFTPNTKDSTHLIKYCIEKDEYIESTEYPGKQQEIQGISAHNHILRDNILTIFTTNDKKTYEFCLNLDCATAQWKIETSEYNGKYFALKSIVVLPNDDMHGVNSCGQIYKYNKNDKHWQRLDFNIDPQYMEFNHFNNTIYCFDGDKVYIYDESYPSIVENELSLPIKAVFGVLNPCRCIFVMYGRILILFDFKNEMMYFVDVSKNETKWIEKTFYKGVVLENWQCLFIVITKYNFIHFINTYPRGTVCHYKVSLYHLLPDILCKRYVEPLVYGFVRNIDMEIYIPIEIKQQIIYIITN